MCRDAILYIIAEILLTVVLIPIKLASMSYVIPDTLLKVLLNPNKTGHHVIRYTWHIVVSGITYNMVTSFIGV
jgi:hypothetical protein